MEYTMVRNFSMTGLVQTVNEHLKDGWEPYGPPLVDEAEFFQALVKGYQCDLGDGTYVVTNFGGND